MRSGFIAFATCYRTLIAYRLLSIGLHFYDMKNHAICVIFFCISTFYLSYFIIFICVLHSILSFAKYKFSFVKCYRASFVKIIYPDFVAVY